MGITALVLGVVALLISWVPILNNIAAIVGFVGFILGIFAIRSTGPKGKRSGRGLSVAGTLICVVSVGIVLFTQHVYSKALDEAIEAIDKPAAVAKKDTTDSKKEDKNESALIAGKYLIENIQVKKTGIDYEGKATVLVSWDMTNKSDAESNMFDVNTKIFQNKVQLESAIYVDAPEGYDSQSSMKEILPGGKKTVTTGYVLSDENAPVTVKISGTFDLSKNSPEIVKEFPLN